jgi:mono/diheme cytochrome c family protein
MSKGAFGFSASIWMLLVGWVVLSATPSQTPAARPDAGVDAHASPGETLTEYCVTCHNDRTRTGGLTLEGLDVSRPADAGETWESVIRKLRTRAMPPPGMRRPAEAAYESTASFLEAGLDRAAASRPIPGRPLIRRLNRTEYGNAIRDLLHLDVDVSSYLPPDDSAFGFDNISDVLGVSPALLERYLVAADRISELAVGAPVSPGSMTYRIRQDRSQDQHIDGLPLGTVGGLSVGHTFPLDAEYHFSLSLYRTNLEAIRGLEHPHQVEITVDGERVFFGTVGGDLDRDERAGESITDRSDAVDARLQVRVPVRAGTRTVGATFIRKIGGGTQRLRPFLRSSAGTYDATGRPHIETLTIAGPFHPTGPGDTATRQRLFVCVPARRSEEAACARRIISQVARRAYRRPLADADLKMLLGFYRVGRERGSFDTGIQLALRRVLASPSFVFRVEDETRAGSDDIFRISDIELASRLSFFLWSSIPDDELLAVAARGELRRGGVLEKQVLRMLADPRADALAENFAGQWLHLRNLRTIVPNHDEFPDFDDTLREAFRREAELFFDSIVREDRSVIDLLTADHTFVNERLAKHYGLPNVYGSHFRRVTLRGDERLGLLGKGGLLLATSHADRTAPVVRGKWILENIMGTPPPPPPADVPLLEETTDAGQPRTLRARMEMHRASPACAGCHRVMDPLGFAMENFDAVGAWRAHEGGLPIDASGRLADGSAIDGVVALRQALVSRSDVFVRTFTEKLLTYALGRGLQYSDMPVVRAIVRDAGRHDYRISSLVMGIVTSTPFQMRMKADSGRRVADRRS